jgi:hypothetical protein
MGKQFSSIESGHREFILGQHVFFVASAAPHGRVNISPKDVRSLRLPGPNLAAYLDLTGSGNETAAHLRVNKNLTFMFCALEGSPMILRLYGQGRVLRRSSREYEHLLATEFENSEPLGARQMIVLNVDLVLTSCGYGVPLFQFRGDRHMLERWAEAKGRENLEEYRREKNAYSIDGLSTGLFSEHEED